ncbi:MAG: AAA family ATPase [Chloroflexota bacterium]
MDPLRLSQMGFKNYKNLASVDSVNLHNLNILIGPNGSGKTNFIRLLKFLRDAVQNKGESHSVTAFDKAIIDLGGDRALDMSVSMPASIEIDYSFAQNNLAPYRQELQLLIKDSHKKPIINREALSQSQPNKPDEPFYFYQCHNKQSGAGVVTYYSDPPSQKTEFQKINDVPVDELALVSIPRLLENSNIPSERTPLYQVRRQIIEHVSNWQFFNANDMNLSEIRTSEPNLGPTDTFLMPSGENLPLVMENLSQQSIEFEEMLTDEIRKILPWTRKVRATRSGRLKLTVEWHMEFPQGRKEQFYLSEMSDGSVRMLCWAIVLLSPVLPTLLVIEEPEIGIHVSWLPVLAGWIKKASSKTQVIISTHSPDLLDHFTDEINNVLVMAKNETINHRFDLKPLSPDLLQDKLEEGWQLGDLYRVGDTRVGGWPW